MKPLSLYIGFEAVCSRDQLVASMGPVLFRTRLVYTRRNKQEELMFAHVW